MKVDLAILCVVYAFYIDMNGYYCKFFHQKIKYEN